MNARVLSAKVLFERMDAVVEDLNTDPQSEMSSTNSGMVDVNLELEPNSTVDVYVGVRWPGQPAQRGLRALHASCMQRARAYVC